MIYLEPAPSHHEGIGACRQKAEDAAEEVRLRKEQEMLREQFEREQQLKKGSKEGGKVGGCVETALR